MAETKGARAAIDRMTKSLKEGSKGKMTSEQARKIAVKAAKRHDRRNK